MMKKIVFSAAVLAVFSVSANAYLFEGLFGGTEESTHLGDDSMDYSLDDIGSQIVVPPHGGRPATVVNVNQGAGGTAHFDEHGMIVADSTFQKVPSNGAWTHMGETQVSTVTLAAATPKKNPPSFGGGDEDSEDGHDYNEDGSYAGVDQGDYNSPDDAGHGDGGFGADADGHGGMF